LPYYLAEARRLGSPVLELACGTGRLTIPVAQQGQEIVGLDLSPAMLSTARAKADAAGCRIDFVAGDMRSFALERRFNLIFIAANSLLHMTTVQDLMACLARVRHHLAANGWFVFDIFNPDVSILARDPRRRFLVGKFADAAGLEVTLEEATDYDATTQVNRINWYFSKPGHRDFFVVPLWLRCIFPQELPLLLEAGGLRLEARYGDFSGGAFESGSGHQVCLCRAI
jgi:SAM-dependent methyltransferase